MFLLSCSGLAAHAMEQCDSTSKSEVSYESNGLKITFIQGDIAKQAWDNLDITPTAVKSRTGDLGYNAKAKYSEGMNCWKYQPKKYINGTEVGPSNCDHYSCNIIGH